MEKDFIPYEQALALKELGFNEPCLMAYIGENKQLYSKCDDVLHLNAKDVLNPLKAPTFSQAFRWFREKYNLFGKVYIVNFGADEYSFDIYDLYEEKYKYENFIGAGASYTGTFETYEEAELACLQKLIQIVKDEKFTFTAN